MTNARIMREALLGCGLKVYGGENAPYLWVKAPKGLTSWKFFDKLLYEVNIVGTPGVGFGPSGEGYLRLTLPAVPQFVQLYPFASQREAVQFFRDNRVSAAYSGETRCLRETAEFDGYFLRPFDFVD